jgi:DNA-binding response OmpR family regulator
MLTESEYNRTTPPCLVLAHSDGVYKAAIARGFRRLGWDVYLADDGPEVRRLVAMLEADAVILDAELPGESGWLTCAKLTAEQPFAKVVLISSEPGPRNRQFAAFVGACALVRPSAGLAPLLDELRDLAATSCTRAASTT